MAGLRVGMCQLNPVVGDLEGNVERGAAALDRVADAGADLAVFTELAVCGYPPEDLVLKRRFVADCADAMHELASRTTRCPAVIGFPERQGDRVHNAAAVCVDGEVVGVYRKRALPNYSVFDEDRYFEPGSGDLPLFEVAGVRVGVSICEDAWDPHGPIPQLAGDGAEVVVNLSASPFYAGRLRERLELIEGLARLTGCPVVYVNQVGGQDELVFDGGSFAFDAEGGLLAKAPQFEAGEWVVEVGGDGTGPDPVMAPDLHPVEEVHGALALGTCDYVRKNGFSDVVLGLSGGIDSSVVAMIAADALGAERVHGVLMPSRYSSEHSISDAGALCRNLGMECRTIPIEPAHQAFREMLPPAWPNAEDGSFAGVTDENLQSRLRGVTLMALSNEFGWLVLTTGNKTETSVGYSTLYGDTAGGFAVIKDVPKLLVYELARRRNEGEGRPLIPESVLTKAPSAELRPDQRDEDSLPPYDVLDTLVEAYVEDDCTRKDLVEAGFDADLVERVVTMIDRAEYKRRQSPPGPRVSRKAFGKDRRMPITNRSR